MHLFRLFTQMHLLTDGSVEGQYVTRAKIKNLVQSKKQNKTKTGHPFKRGSYLSLGDTAFILSLADRAFVGIFIPGKSAVWNLSFVEDSKVMGAAFEERTQKGSLYLYTQGRYNIQNKLFKEFG